MFFYIYILPYGSIFINVQNMIDKETLTQSQNQISNG